MLSGSAQLPDACVLRPAKREDAWAIRRLVMGALLDPTQLRWQQFWVIKCERKITACGQLRTFPEAQTLGSLVSGKRLAQQRLRDSSESASNPASRPTAVSGMLGRALGELLRASWFCACLLAGFAASTATKVWHFQVPGRVTAVGLTAT